MASLPNAAAAPAADASGFKLFGQVIQPDVHRAAAAAEEEEEEKSAPPPPPSPPPPPPPPPAPLQGAGGGDGPLPCPRCGSRETKFCYFNNYNVRQPRHLCRACRCYWTAGGALRRVASASPARRRPRPSARSVAAAAAAAAAASTSEGAESVETQS